MSARSGLEPSVGGISFKRFSATLMLSDMH